MQPVTSEDATSVSVLMFPVCACDDSRAHVHTHIHIHMRVCTCVCVYVCMSVAVCKIHMARGLDTHTSVYMYVKTLKGSVQFLQSTVPLFSKNTKENIFSI